MRKHMPNAVVGGGDSGGSESGRPVRCLPALPCIMVSVVLVPVEFSVEDQGWTMPSEPVQGNVFSRQSRASAFRNRVPLIAGVVDYRDCQDQQGKFFSRPRPADMILER